MGEVEDKDAGAFHRFSEGGCRDEIIGEIDAGQVFNVLCTIRKRCESLTLEPIPTMIVIDELREVRLLFGVF